MHRSRSSHASGPNVRSGDNMPCLGQGGSVVIDKDG